MDKIEEDSFSDVESDADTWYPLIESYGTLSSVGLITYVVERILFGNRKGSSAIITGERYNPIWYLPQCSPVVSKHLWFSFEDYRGLILVFFFFFFLERLDLKSRS